MAAAPLAPWQLLAARVLLVDCLACGSQEAQHPHCALGLTPTSSDKASPTEEGAQVMQGVLAEGWLVHMSCLGHLPRLSIQGKQAAGQRPCLLSLSDYSYCTSPLREASHHLINLSIPPEATLHEH